MDMEWIITFASASNPTAQISIIKNNNTHAQQGITISIEVDDIENLYQKATEMNYKIVYPITNETWSVRRFFVEDPNSVIINLMHHIVPTVK